MKKNCQVLMLLTNTNNYSKGDIIKLREDKLVIADYNMQYANNSSANLYFTSNEVIKEGDWYIYDNRVFQSEGQDYNGTFNLVLHRGGWTKASLCTKVIATTDKSLNLPIIPQSFVEEYVKSNGEIKEVPIAYCNDGSIAIINILKKKQTLEEAAHELTHKYFRQKYGRDIHINRSQDKYYDSWNAYYSGIIAGAKWQQSNP